MDVPPTQKFRFSLRRLLWALTIAAAMTSGMLAMTSTPAGATDKLRPGQKLTCGHYLKSANGLFRFVFQCDGNLVLLDKPNRVRWNLWGNENPKAKGGVRLLLQTDGNLVLFNKRGKVVWHWGTYGHPGAYLKMQDDGNLVLLKRSVPIKDTHTSANCDRPKVCLYDWPGASGYVVYDTRATTIANYTKPALRFHNGAPVNNHVGSVYNNSNSTVCFYDGANYKTKLFCLAPHTKRTNLPRSLRDRISSHKAKAEFAFPVSDRQRFTELRTDRGQDFITNDGSPVRAVASGTVVYAGPWSGFTKMLIIHLDKPFAGYPYVFYGHVKGFYVPVGRHVQAGDNVVMAGGAGTSEPGLIEVGFMPANRDVERTHRCSHQTNSGRTMHSLLHVLRPDRVGSAPITTGCG